MRKIYITLFIIIVLFSCFQQKYRIGLITNLEGPNSASAIEAVNSIKVCYEVYKESVKNPIDVEIITLDDSWNPEKTKKAYSIMKEKANIIIFGSTSSVFMPVYDDVKKDDNILGFVVAGISEISNIDDNIIRTILDTEKEQKSIANFLLKRNPKRLLIIQENDKNIKYTEQSLAKFLNYYTNKNYDIATFSANKLDLKDVIDKVKNNKYDYAYFIAGGVPREVAIVIQNIKNIDPSIISLTLPWVNDKVLLSSLGEKQDRIITSAVSIMDDTNEKYVKFKENFTKKIGTPPTSPLSAVVYDQTSILIETFSKIKTDNAKKVKKYIISNEFEGITGKIKFNQFGDCERDLYFFEINNGEKRLIKE